MASNRVFSACVKPFSGLLFAFFFCFPSLHRDKGRSSWGFGTKREKRTWDKAVFVLSVNQLARYKGSLDMGEDSLLSIVLRGIVLNYIAGRVIHYAPYTSLLFVYCRRRD
jgi:hypothetical protein